MLFCIFFADNPFVLPDRLLEVVDVLRILGVPTIPMILPMLQPGNSVLQCDDTLPHLGTSPLAVLGIRVHLLNQLTKLLGQSTIRNVPEELLYVGEVVLPVEMGAAG